MGVKFSVFKSNCNTNEGKTVLGLNVEYVQSSNKQDSLFKAVIENNDIYVKDILLKNGGDADKEYLSENDNNYYKGIDIAWKNFVEPKNESSKDASNKIILHLLKANSTYPKEFSYNNASKEVQDFVDKCEELHKFDSVNSGVLKTKIKLEPNLRYFYDRNNQSLMLNTLKSRNYHIYDILKNNSLYFGSHESDEIQELYSNLEFKAKSKIRKLNEKNANELQNAYICVLISRTRISRNCRPSKKQQEIIEEAYRLLNQEEGFRKTLKIVAACRRFKINFDFEHNTAHFFDPTVPINMEAYTYVSGEIQIGAKDLLHKNKNYEVIGTIGHEMSHLAFLMTFMNGFKPYQKGESKHKEMFDKVYEECKNNQEREELVKLALSSVYNAEQHHLELIVRPIHMIMKYYGNKKNIEECKKNFPALFSYLREVVEPELEKALPILIKLQDDKENVIFSELTGPMKAKIMHEKIKFQGIEITLSEIIGNDEEIFNLLPSNDIKRILLSTCVSFEFGDVCEKNEKYVFIERKFESDKSLGNKLCYVETSNDEFSMDRGKSFEEIIVEVKNSKIFLLSGKAGEGKTTTFEELTKHLKENYKSFWVSFIKLRSLKNVFDEYFELNRDLTLNEVFEIFCKILFSPAREKKINFNCNFEARIFKKLFFDNSVILLFDGFDEISPKFNKLILKILEVLEKETRNQLWISTRPHHVKQITEKFNVVAFKLKKYSDKDRKQLIKEIFKRQENSIFEQNDIKKLKKFFLEYADFNNPLFITIITELYVKRKIDFESKIIDRYGIFKNLIDAQMETLETKIDFEDRKLTESFSLLKVFQVLALKFIFEEDQIKNLSIIKEWKKENDKWTAEKIQRFGFVSVSSNFCETGDKNSIDFLHYSYAEFFLTQFIIENIFYEDLKDEQIDIIFDLLKILKPKWSEDYFLLSYLKNHWDSSKNNLHIKMKDSVVKAIEYGMKNKKIYNIEHLLYLRFWCPFLKNDTKELRRFWLVEKDKSLLNEFLFSDRELCMSNFLSFINSFSDCLGENWHEILNKNDEKLYHNSIDENKMKEKIIPPSNLFKFLVLVEKSFNDTQKKIIKHKIHFWFSSVCNEQEGLLKRIAKQIFKIYQHDVEMIASIFIIVNSKIKSIENINKFYKFLEKTYKNDREKLRKIIFHDKVRKCFLYNIFNSETCNKGQNIKERLKAFINLCTIYKNSWEEIQNVLFSNGNLLEILKYMKSDFIPIILESSNEVFESNKEKMIDYIEIGNNYIINAIRINSIERFQIFFNEFFEGNENLLKKCMRKVLMDNRIEVKMGNSQKFIENFRKIMNICKKYLNSNEELKNFLKSTRLCFAVLHNLTNETYEDLKEILADFFKSSRRELIECLNETENLGEIIKSEVKFPLVEKFLYEFLYNNEDDAKNCIRNILLNDYTFFEALNETLCNTREFEKIHKIFKKYLTNEEFKQKLCSYHALHNGIDQNNTQCGNCFLKHAKDPFKLNKEELMECKFNSNSLFKLIETENKFKHFLEYLKKFYGNDESEAREFVRKFLLDSRLHLLLKCSESEFIHAKKMYTDYKNSWEELQNYLTSSKDLLKMFSNVRYENYNEFEEFLTKIFHSNKQRFFDCINYNDGYLLFENVKSLKNFERFMINFIGDDKNQTTKCMRDILFEYYGNRLNPVRNLARYKNLNDFKMIIGIYKKYKTSWEDMQKFFSCKHLKVFYFRNFTSETYEEFENFMKEIFHSDKTSLRKSYEEGSEIVFGKEKIENHNYVCKNTENFERFRKFIYEEN